MNHTECNRCYLDNIFAQERQCLGVVVLFFFCFFFFQTSSHLRILKEIFLYKQMFSEIKKSLLCFVVASFEVRDVTFISPMFIIFALYSLIL